MNALVYPVEHHVFDPGCVFCSLSQLRSCGEVCNACGCSWNMDLFDEPNRADEACNGPCDCHTWTLVESRAAARNEDHLEAAWKAVGYSSSMQVYQSEGR
jgi:hypothetical protein